MVTESTNNTARYYFLLKYAFWDENVMGSMASMTDFSTSCTCKRKNGQSDHAYMNHLEKLAAKAFPGCSSREYHTRLMNQFTMHISDPELQYILIGLNSEVTIDEAMAVRSHITSKEQPATLNRSGLRYGRRYSGKVLRQAEQRKRENTTSRDIYQGNRHDKGPRFRTDLNLLI